MLALPWLITSVHWSVSHRVETASCFFFSGSSDKCEGGKSESAGSITEDDDDGEARGPCPCSLFKNISASCSTFSDFLNFASFEVWIFVLEHPIVPSMRRLVPIESSETWPAGGCRGGERFCVCFAGYDSIYRLGQASITANKFLEQTVNASLGFEVLDYDAVHGLKSEWRLLPAFDHPEEPARCLVSVPGLTHKARRTKSPGDAREKKPRSSLISMRMYQAGLREDAPLRANRRRSGNGYKGCGTVLRAHGGTVGGSRFGLDGGEEAEVARLLL